MQQFGLVKIASRLLGITAALSFLVGPQALGQPTLFDFPSNDSVIVAETGFLNANEVGHFWSVARGDKVEERFESCGAITRANLNVEVVENLLNSGAVTDWVLDINGNAVGGFTVPVGFTGPVNLDVSFALIAGPVFDVVLRVTNEVPGGAGSITLAYDNAFAHSIEFECEGACCTNGPGTVSECIMTSQADCEANHSLYLGDGSICTDDLDCVELAVTFESLSTEARPDGVMIRWTTGAEVDAVGFRVLRETLGAREKALRVIAPMIPAAGNGLTGASYEFLDNSLRPGEAVQYYVEDVDIFGKVTRHGPITVHRIAPTQRTNETRLGTSRNEKLAPKKASVANMNLRPR